MLFSQLFYDQQKGKTWGTALQLAREVGSSRIKSRLKNMFYKTGNFCIFIYMFHFILFYDVSMRDKEPPEKKTYFIRILNIINIIFHCVSFHCTHKTLHHSLKYKAWQLVHTKYTIHSMHNSTVCTVIYASWLKRPYALNFSLEDPSFHCFCISTFRLHGVTF